MQTHHTEYTATFLGSDTDGNNGEQRDWFEIRTPETTVEVGRVNDVLIDADGVPLTAGDTWTQTVRRAIRTANS